MEDLAAHDVDGGPSRSLARAAVVDLAALRTALEDLALWADTALNEDFRDRQYIAEYLGDAVWALAHDDTPPARPF